jgi:hypothetical protein
MKHIRVDRDSFEFSNDPFPAFRSSLIFGRNKRDFQFLPVKDVPIDEDGLMPENKFRLIKTKAKGTLMIVPGIDTTNRALVFCGINDGFRGSSGILDETDAQIIKHCHAAAACEGRNEVIALLKPGQQAVLYSRGRRTNYVICHNWDGNNLHTTEYKRSEWDALQQDQEDYEIV